MNETNCERGEGGATERHRQVRREAASVDGLLNLLDLPNLLELP
jgi:hypothetical protein